MKISGDVPVFPNKPYIYTSRTIRLSGDDPKKLLQQSLEKMLEEALNQLPMRINRQEIMSRMVLPKELQLAIDKKFPKKITNGKVEPADSTEPEKDITLELEKVEQAVQALILNQAENMQAAEEDVQTPPFDAVIPE